MPRPSAAAFFLSLSALLAACSGIPRAYGGDVSLHTQLSGGYRAVDHEVFEGHEVAGIEFVTCDPEVGWGYALGALYGTEEEDGAAGREAEFSEVYLGLRRTWHPDGRLRPYLGLGGAWALVENTLSSGGTLDEKGGGGYVHGGVLWSLGTADIERRTEILLGLDLRGELGDDFDYGQAALVLGFGW